MTLEYRQAKSTVTERDTRTITGIAVPFSRETEIFPGYFEQFSPTAITVPAAGCKLLSEHRHAIGTVEGTPNEQGWEITGKIAKTQRGDEALELALSGVYTGLSVGFEMKDFQDRSDEDGHLHRTVTAAVVREVSLTPFPAYEDAKLFKATRMKNTNERQTTMPQNPDQPKIIELQSAVEDITRTVELLQTHHSENPAARTDTRSAATFLKSALTGNDEDLRSLQNLQERAYSGGTSKDTALTPQWVGDLTRLVDQGAGIRPLFATGSLPAEGFTLEYAQLKNNTMKVEQQSKEGSPLPTGNVSVETRTAEISTFGGATSLSRQEIERGHVRILDHHLRAMALAAGQRARAEFHATYESSVTQAESDGSKVTGKPLNTLKWNDWVNLTIEAAKMFGGLGLRIENLICDTTVFKSLATLENPNHTLMKFTQETDNIGTLSLTGLKGTLLSIPVVLDIDATTPSAVFQNSLAIRSYLSSLVRLQDENILNLTKDFSVYFYGAFAKEMPQALIPITGLAG